MKKASNITGCAVACMLLRLVTPTDVAAAQAAPGQVVRRLEEATVGVPQQILDAQYEALLRIGPEFVTYRANGIPKSIRGNLGIDLAPLNRPDVPDEVVSSLFQSLKALLLTEGTEHFVLAHRSTASGVISIRFTQMIGGIPVIPSGVTLTTARGSTRAVSLSAYVLPDRSLTRTPSVGRDEAMKIATAAFTASSGARAAGDPALVYFFPDDSAGGVLGWRVSFADPQGFPWVVEIDAISGTVLRCFEDTTDGIWRALRSSGAGGRDVSPRS